MKTKASVVAIAAMLLSLAPLSASGARPTRKPEQIPVVPHVHPAGAPEGVHAPLDSPYRRLRRGRSSWAGAAVTAHVPVALVEFNDNQATFAERDLRDMFFQRHYPHGAGSFADFYADQSGGALSIDGETSPWLRMPRPYSEYVGSNHGMQMGGTNAWTLVQDAVAAADPSIDFCRGDTDGDLLVDTFALVHAGPGASETGSGLWAISWSMPAPVTTEDTCGGEPVRVKNFIIVPERHADTSLSAPGAPPGLGTIGAISHEFGHVLGLPDLYDTSFKTPGGVGPWDVMGTGSWGLDGRTPWRPTPLSAWCRIQLGWARAPHVREDRVEVALDSSDAARSGVFDGIYRLGPEGDAATTEHFLVERRTRTGFAADFPRDGILVWRIAPEGRRVYLVQADGRDELGAPGSSWAYADGGDMFPGTAGVTEVDDTTTPSTRFSTGAASGITLAGIRGGGTALSMFVTPAPDAPPAPPSNLTAVALARATQLTWSASSEATVFEYRIYRRSGGDLKGIGAVASSTTRFDDPSPPTGPVEYVVRAYNRRESADSNVATVTSASGARDHAPTSVTVVVGKKVQGGAGSLASTDGRALKIASARRHGGHRVEYVISVPVPGDPNAVVLTGLVDRNLRASVSVRTDSGTWIDAGRLDASPSSRFSLRVDDPRAASKGSVTVRIRTRKGTPFAHKLNSFGVTVP